MVSRCDVLLKDNFWHIISAIVISIVAFDDKASKSDSASEDIILIKMKMYIHVL